ncbi:LysR family transcriptional regulator [Ottowia sp. GY511]|uniref:LysR substrate-binding domain-containing protein n=1 Tax=Ottowia flava TaxID=2675430 RepID=A0ABW4KST6_9BURK|nr:LysR family transcriptional regulator [Ottowia sp. GY511]TXK33067.1 LysR family transcriptional regulator [Ottowia sp. GY511]
MGRRFDHVPDLEAFVVVVELGSMSAAAVALATTPSVVSRAVARLEARLRCQLLRRSTRRLSLTEKGRQYWEHAQGALAQIEAVERELRDSDGAPQGRVRLTAPTTYGHHRLPEYLARFTRLYPLIELDIDITNRNVDLVAEGFDLAIRLGAPPEREIQARLLEQAALCLVAAPQYLAERAPPSGLSDFAQHRCLPFVLPSTGRVVPWLLQVEGEPVDWQPPVTFAVSGDVLATVSLAAQGLGICQTYDFAVKEDLSRGRLVEVLPQMRGRSRPFHLLYPPRKRLTTAARLLTECLLGHGPG